MATRKPHFDDYTLGCLAKAIAGKIGFVIAGKPDCARLSALILKQTHAYLSEATLYRLFFQAGKYRPYKSTLDILCAFVGFSDSFHFLAQAQSEKNLMALPSSASRNEVGNTLIYHCIENESHTALWDYFDSLEETSEGIKEQVCLTLFDALQKSEKRQQFFERFAVHPYVREYFFEKGHDPKFRIKQYDGAYKKYLRGINNKDEQAALQDSVFGHAVLFRHYFLFKKYKEAFQMGQSLYVKQAHVESNRKHLHVFPYMRYLAYKLWYLQMNSALESSREHYVAYLLEVCGSIKHTLDEYEQNILFYTIAEAFVGSDLPEVYHWKLKELFCSRFDQFPELVYSKHLRHSLRYFEPNGLMRHRP